MNLGVVSDDGTLTSASAELVKLLTSSELIPASVPHRFQPTVWSVLSRAPDDTPLEVSTPIGPMTLSRYPLDGERSLVVVRRTGDEEMSKRLLHATQQMFSRVVAGAAHDMRSPLSTMTLSVSVLRRRWGELPREEIEALLDDITACCERQQRAIDAIVRSASVSGMVDLSLLGVLRRVSEILRPVFRRGKNELKINVDESIEIRGTPLSLEHIFMNLINNAAQSRESPVTVEAEIAGYSRINGVKMVRVLIKDNGPGIAEDVRERIFEPFFTTKIDGLGMGLALSREAARQLGGELLLLWPRNPGACFEVRLPLVRGSALLHGGNEL